MGELIPAEFGDATALAKLEGNYHMDPEAYITERYEQKRAGLPVWIADKTGLNPRYSYYVGNKLQATIYELTTMQIYELRILAADPEFLPLPVAVKKAEKSTTQNRAS